MVAGHLREQHGKYHIILEYRDEHNKRMKKQISTGLVVKGNKKKAEALLMEARQAFIPPIVSGSENGSGGIRLELPVQCSTHDSQGERQDSILFADFIQNWLEVKKSSISISTFNSYMQSLEVIVPYFKEKGITLQGLQPIHIQEFYREKLKKVSACTVLKYHANITCCLKFAVKMDMIMANPTDKVERPKKEPYRPKFYNKDEMVELFEVVRGHALEIPVIFGGFYGMRRGEAIGMRIDDMDFKANTITICNTVVDKNWNEKKTLIAQQKTKNKSSTRTLPLVSPFRELLLDKIARIEKQKKRCGKSYNKEWLGYINVDELGNLIRPDYLTCQFPAFLKKNGLKTIRFHDLRHSCAGIMLAAGVSLKEIQEWLGHSDFATTANIYAHLTYSQKISSANTYLMDLGYMPKMIVAGALEEKKTTKNQADEFSRPTA